MNNLIAQLLEIPEESNWIEFKRLNNSWRIVSKIIDTIVAMANSEGGFIILWIDDPEKTKLKGLNRVFWIEESLECHDSIWKEIQKISPPLSSIWEPEIIAIKELWKRVAIIKIPKSADSFHSFNWHVYVRQEKSNKRLTPQEVVKLSYAKWFEKSDKELVEVDFSLLQTKYYEEWRNKRSINGKNIMEILEKVWLARKLNWSLLPTKAAVMLFAEYPTNLMDTKCAIRIYKYTWTLETIWQTPNLIWVPETIDWPLVELIKKSQEYVLTLLRSGITIHSWFKTKYQIPERATKEAITNAVIHRDYHIKRDIAVKIFEDRIEITSPWLFPYNITSANIWYIRADSYRNDLLVKHLREFPFPPNLDENEWIKAMRSEMNSWNLYPPIFWTYPHSNDSVKVILLNEKRATEWEKINSYLKKNKYITNEEARLITWITQRDKMSKILKKWVNKWLLIQIKPWSWYMKWIKYRIPDVSEINNLLAFQ